MSASCTWPERRRKRDIGPGHEEIEEAADELAVGQVSGRRHLLVRNLGEKREREGDVDGKGAGMRGGRVELEPVDGLLGVVLWETEICRAERLRRMRMPRCVFISPLLRRGNCLASLAIWASTKERACRRWLRRRCERL